MWNKKQKGQLHTIKEKEVRSKVKKLNDVYKEEYQHIKFDSLDKPEFAYWYIDIEPTMNIPGLKEALKLLWPGIESKNERFPTNDTTINGHKLRPDNEWFPNGYLDLNSIKYNEYFHNYIKTNVKNFIETQSKNVLKLFNVTDDFIDRWSKADSDTRRNMSTLESDTDTTFFLGHYRNCYTFKKIKMYYTQKKVINPDIESKEAMLEKELYTNREYCVLDEHSPSTPKWLKDKKHKSERTKWRSKDIKKELDTETDSKEIE